MNREIKFFSCAEEDVINAINWYEEKVTGLGNRFLLSLDATIQIISRNPEAFPIVYKDFRRALFHRFPYSVFYFVENDKVVIISVFHEKRDPSGWKSR